MERVALQKKTAYSKKKGNKEVYLKYQSRKQSVKC